MAENPILLWHDVMIHPLGSAEEVRVSRSGVTIAEILVTIGVIGLLLSLLMPAVEASREQSRAVTCRNHLKQLAIAAHAYEATNRRFPYMSTGWIDAMSQRRYANSAHRCMAAFWDPDLGRKMVFDDPTDPGWTSSASTVFSTPSLREVQGKRVPFLACPTDVIAAGSTSYRCNIGISVHILPPSATIESTSQKGAFVNGRAIALSEFRDGLTNTALFSERVLGDYDPSRYDAFRDLFADGQARYTTAGFIQHCRDDATFTPPHEFSFAGGSWLLGGYLNTWYSHVLTPNSLIPDCSFGPAVIDGGPGVVAARSFHRGGVHVAKADSAVSLVSNSINLGIWRALGTRNGGELYIARPKVRCLTATPSACAPTPMALGLNNQTSHFRPCEV